MTPATQTGQLGSSVKDGNCAAKTWFGAKEDKSACKVCDACGSNAKPDCVLYPYNSGCCSQNCDAHHVIPVRCFLLPGERSKPVGSQKCYDGCDDYSLNRAPCICLDGDSHKKMHNEQNPLEAAAGNNTDHPGRWSYEQARDNCAGAVEKIAGTKENGEPKCTKECIAAQLDEYHKATKDDGGANIENKTLLRADPSGKLTTSKMAGVPTSTGEGAGNM